MRIFRNKVFVRCISFFFLFEIVSTVIQPTVSWALTSGPTAPEASSFEPVDTTDLVNTITGDFVYNIPLFEVPGPAGGYPLSLSYHSGIQPELEASWVGLGWTLNPGAINRITNGIPDDFNKSYTSNWNFWEGGETLSSSIGVSVGFANLASVGAGVTFASDTYMGKGVGGYVSFGVGKNFAGAKVSASVTLGIAPYGEKYWSVGVGASFDPVRGSSEKSIGLSTSIGFSISSHGVSGGISVSNSNEISISSEVGSGSANVSLPSGAGFKMNSNLSKSNNISSESSSFQAEIPVYYMINIRLGQEYKRYWMDVDESYENFGSLFFPDVNTGDMANKLYDTYHVQGLESISGDGNPAKYLEGSFPDYDTYYVSGQGIGGSFRPHHYTLSLYSQDVVKDDGAKKEVLGYYIPQHSKGVHYRFVDDFSNRVLNESTEIEVNQNIQRYYEEASSGGRVPHDEGYDEWKGRLGNTYSYTENVPLLFPYGSPVTGLEGYNGDTRPKRMLPNVPGSRHIEYFTNAQIIDSINSSNSRGFIECNASGFIRKKAAEGHVGAFAITNSSGVTYHFSLPAYAFDEYSYQQKKDIAGRYSFNNRSQKGRYAYTWYLTGVTGPDYVDRGPNGNPNGKLDEHDWGYWVEFQYGLWADEYHWRNPGIGFNNDIDHNFQTASKGKKELYYLNSIKTATHTALFIKELRADAKGNTAAYDNSVLTSILTKEVEWIDEGGFEVRDIPFEPCEYDANLSLQYSILPVSTLSLKSVLIFDNKDLVDSVNYQALDNKYDDNYYFEYNSNLCSYVSEKRYHFGNNVIDVNDLNNPQFPKSKAIRSIEFDYDYSLTPNTPNSFDPEGLLYSGEYFGESAVSLPPIMKSEGKLTLKALRFKGKGGVEALPPMRFYYDYKNPPKAFGILQFDSTSSNSTSFKMTEGEVEEFSDGDIVVLKNGSATYYGFIRKVIVSPQGWTKWDMKILNPPIGAPVGGRPFEFVKTKNPPYNKDLYDIWGYYKVDYEENNSYNLSRLPTQLSAVNTDVWALREIESSLGSQIKIAYESDSYFKSVYNNNLTVKLTKNTDTGPMVFNCDDYIPNVPDSMPPITKSYSFIVDAVSTNSDVDFTKLYNVGEALDIVAEAKVTYPVYDTTGLIGSETDSVLTTFGKAIAITKDKLKIKACYFSTVHPDSVLGVEFSAGRLFLKSSVSNKGGGVRVKSISVQSPQSNQISTTNYQYEFDGIPSGVTTYVPISMEDVSGAEGYKKEIFRRFMEIFSLARDIPNPAVYYSRVRITQSYSEKDLPPTLIKGFVDYYFESYDRNMVGFDSSIQSVNDSIPGSYRGQTYDRIVTRKVKLKNYSQRLGNLKAIVSYDENGGKISEQIFHYLHDELVGVTFEDQSNQFRVLTDRYKNQGVIQETFNHARWVNKNLGELHGIISKKEQYPSVQTGITKINYKTGIKTESHNIAFDFYSGEVLKTVDSDGYGNKYVTEEIPAYTVYPSMGLKANYQHLSHFDNMHMISQKAAEYVYKVQSDSLSNEIGLVSASVQTWSDSIPSLQSGQLSIQATNQSGIWRKHKTFYFIGNSSIALDADGLYPANQVTKFSFGDDSNIQQGWQLDNENSLVDIYSHVLESRDLNDQYSASLMSIDQTRVFATVQNARYGESSFTGIEERPDLNGNFSGMVNIGNATRDSTRAHTGSKSLRLDAGGRGCSVKVEATSSRIKYFLVSVWVHQASSASARLNYQFFKRGATPVPESEIAHLEIIRKPEKKAGDWHLVEAYIPVPALDPGAEHYIELSIENTGASGVWIDDFRILPANGVMVSYVYNRWGELTFILDGNNLYTEYKYDNLGRLTQIVKESLLFGVAKVSEVKYNYSIK